MATMASLLEHKLIVVTGKGGTGKTTVACALGLLAARGGLRTIVAEVGSQHRLPTLFGLPHTAETGVEVELEERLWSTSIDPDRALIEWLRTLGGRISVRMLAASSSFHYFAAAAPGAKELVSMVKVRELCEGRHRRKGTERYDLVVLDAPATGHALAMLSSPQTFSAIVRAGPLADQAQGVRELLEDRKRSAYVAVTHATEMAVTETLELEEGLRRRLDRDLDAVVVNGTVPRRFTKQELARILDATGTHSRAQPTGDGRTDGDARSAEDAPPTDDVRLVRSAAHTARAVYEQARLQQSQIARLRRQRFAGGAPPGIITIPFAFVPELDLAAVKEMTDRLERTLER
jgi:anion-transporting  ArsA/GET3 family ATPase